MISGDPGLGPREAGASSQGTEGPQLGQRLCAYITSKVGQTPPGALMYGAGSHSSHKGTFYPWMDAKLLLVVVGGDMTRDILFSRVPDVAVHDNDLDIPN